MALAATAHLRVRVEQVLEPAGSRLLRSAYEKDLPLEQLCHRFLVRAVIERSRWTIDRAHGPSVTGKLGRNSRLR